MNRGLLPLPLGGFPVINSRISLPMPGLILPIKPLLPLVVEATLLILTTRMVEDTKPFTFPFHHHYLLLLLFMLLSVDMFFSILKYLAVMCSAYEKHSGCA
jgi:hypothetical protein